MKHGLTHSRTVAFALILVLLGTVPAIAQNTFPTSGNVGIGTTSPSGLLHIHGTGRTELFLDAPLQNNLVLTFQADGANRFSLYREAVTGDFAIDSNQAANLFRMTSLGNVGIGTTTPLAQLHVAGSGRTSIFVDAPLANAATMTFLSASGPRARGREARHERPRPRIERDVQRFVSDKRRARGHGNDEPEREAARHGQRAGGR